MTNQVVRIARAAGYEVSPRGVRQFYPPGDYKVPEQMPPETARRCLESGCGTEVRTKQSKPENKLQAKPLSSTVARETKKPHRIPKKKRSRKKVGATR